MERERSLSRMIYLITLTGTYILLMLLHLCIVQHTSANFAIYSTLMWLYSHSKYRVLSTLSPSTHTHIYLRIYRCGIDPDQIYARNVRDSIEVCGINGVCVCLYGCYACLIVFEYAPASKNSFTMLTFTFLI